MDKRYEEALERAKMILCSLPEGSSSSRDIETIFPELQESEDERIRKELIEALRQLDREKSPVDTYQYQGWIAWLEKQKEQQPVPALDRGDEIILKAICEELKDAPGWVERIEGWYRLAKDAQQPAECSDCKEYDLGFERGREEGVTAGYNKAMKEVEQKEQEIVGTKDVCVLDNTPSYNAAKKYFDSWIEIHRDSPTKWGCFWEGLLYSGKLSKPAEWSEGDERIRKNICRIVKEHMRHCAEAGLEIVDHREALQYLEKQKGPRYTKEEVLEELRRDLCNNDIYRVPEWLREVLLMAKENGKKEQPHWKPSEAQKNALKEVLDMAEAYGILQKMGRTYDDIIELQNDLEEEF